MSQKSPITTHVLDTAHGHPAQGVGATLEFFENGEWIVLAQGTTNNDGRIMDLLPADKPVQKGVYRLTFDTRAYIDQFSSNGNKGFYPYVPIVFEIERPDQHYHVPLLLSPYGYSTYRGS